MAFKPYLMVVEVETFSTETITMQRSASCLFVCVEVLRPSQPNWVMSSALFKTYLTVFVVVFIYIYI